MSITDISYEGCERSGKLDALKKENWVLLRAPFCLGK